MIPISLVSKSPSVVPNTLCKLLVANPTSSTKAGADRLLSTQTNKPVRLADMPADLANEDSSVSEEDSSEVVIGEIREFIEGLRVRNFLTAQQATLLNALLSSNRFVPTRHHVHSSSNLTKSTLLFHTCAAPCCSRRTR